MLGHAFTVVIPTHNRAHLVGRAIQSVLDQGNCQSEVIVVDDASTDETPGVMADVWPQVRYLRQERNQGPGPARTCGIRAASNPWVLLLDDDDTLDPGALELITATLDTVADLEKYPAVQFARSNGRLSAPYLLAGLAHYLRGEIAGDFVAIIQAQRFLSEGLAFPSTRIGAEHLLWWEIAAGYGLPSWAKRVAQVQTDAPTRLTSYEQQIKHARAHAQAQDLTLDMFGPRLCQYSPPLYYAKRLGAATYWLLAGEPATARRRLHGRWRGRHRLLAATLWGLSLLPVAFVRRLFLSYRRSHA